MADLPEKQVKRLKALIQDAETNLAAANELLLSVLGADIAPSSQDVNKNVGRKKTCQTNAQKHEAKPFFVLLFYIKCCKFWW